MPLYQPDQPQPVQRVRRVPPSGPPPVDGTGAGTGAAATASGTGLETLSGTGAGLQAAQGSAGSGLETITGTGAATQTPQSAAGSALETVSANGGGSQAPPSAAGSGSSLLAATGTGAGTGTSATATGAGTETITGTGAGVQTVQTAAGSGSSLMAVTGTGAGTGTAPSAAGSGTSLLAVTGTGAGTGVASSSSGSGSAAAPAADAGAASPILDRVYSGGYYDLLTDPEVYGEGSAAEPSGGKQAVQTASGSGTVLVAGTGAGSQAPQSASGTGVFGSGVAGAGAGTQAPQSASGTGSMVLPVTGTGAGTQAPQNASGTGLMALPVTGTGAGTQAPQSAFGTGTTATSAPVTGTGAGTQAAQSASGSGLMATPVTGTGAGTQPPQSARGTGLAIPNIPGRVIRIDGVDVTDIVRYADAMFISQVNGSAGQCQFAVRDLGHDQGFTFGQPITLDLNGERRWTGYVEKVIRQYSSAVVDTTNPDATARWFLIQGFDNNILFSRRATYDKAHPTKLTSMTPNPSYRDSKHPDQWREDSPSDVVVKWVIEHSTDMFADNVTLDGVENLGSPNPDLAGAYAAGQTVGDFMRSVNRLLGGIYYLKPDYGMVHRFVEEATTDWFLSDYDDGDPKFVGPRDYSFTSDAAEMVNDALVWGTAAGVSTVQFGRETDTAAIAEHGRWQAGEFNQSMYKQASIDHRAHAMVYGNDASRHGAHEDRLVCTATVYEPVFYLGDVVTCKSYVFKDDAGQDPPFESADVLTAILPIRRIAISFPTPTDVKFDLLLTQELDEPWSIYEYRFPKLKVPKIEIEKVVLDPPHHEPTHECDCGKTDEFNRVLPAGGWGQSDQGATWVGVQGPEGASVNGTSGRLDVRASGLPADAAQEISLPIGASAEILYKTSGQAFGGDGEWYMVVGDGTTAYDGSGNNYVLVQYSWPQDVTRSGKLLLGTNIGHGGAYSGVTITLESGHSLGTNQADFILSHFFWVRWLIVRNSDGTITHSAKAWWEGDTEPSTYAVTHTSTSAVMGPLNTAEYEALNFVGTGTDHQAFLVDSLDITGIDRCSATQFDDFNRSTVNGTVGPSKDGHVWNVVAAPSGAGVLQCNGSQLFFATGVVNNNQAEIEVTGTGPWSINHDFTMTAQLTMNVSNNQNRVGLVFGLGHPSEPIYLSLAPTVTGALAVTVAGGSSDGVPLFSSSFPFGDPLMVKWEHHPSSTHTSRAKVWHADRPEPSTWLVTRDTTGDSYGSNTDSFSLFFKGASSSESGFNTFVDYIEFDYAGKPCALDCSGTGSNVVVFDDFSRYSDVNPPDLDTATPSGYDWYGASSPIGTTTSRGINGAYWFAKGGVNFSQKAHGRDDGTDLWATPVWTMSVRFKMQGGNPTASSPFRSATMFFGPFTGSSCALYIAMNSSGGSFQIANGGYSAPGGSGRVFTKNDWVGDTWYVGELQYDVTAGHVRARVYAEGGTIPGWQLDLAVSGLPQLGVTGHFSDFGFLTNTISTSDSAWQIDVDGINFSSGANPCVPCGEGLFEDFDNRTISPAYSYTGWGTPSSGLEPYDANKLQSNEFDTHTTLAVQGGLGKLRAAIGEGIEMPQTSDYANIVAFAGYWFTQYLQTMPNVNVTPATWEMRFRINGAIPGHFPPAPGSGDPPGMIGAMTVQIYWNLTNRTVLDIGISPFTRYKSTGPPNTPATAWDGTSGGGYVCIYGGGFGGDNDGTFLNKTDWQADVWYTVRATVSTARMDIWLWRDELESKGSPLVSQDFSGITFPPAPWDGYNFLAISATDQIHPGSGGLSSWGLNPALGTADLGDYSTEADSVRPQVSIDIDYLSWSPIYHLPSGPCGGVDVPGEPGLPMSGFVCETITHTGGNDFAASRAFRGAPEIYINGNRLLSGFTFSALEGTIHLTTAISGSDGLRLCYQANGVPI